MIVRIVSLQFEAANAETGKQLLKNVASRVRETEGCSHLQILFDVHHSGKVFTLSQWESLAALNKYRKSEFFVNFWSNMRPLLEKEAIARSTYQEMIFP
jgi:quinol monooxygenase YgiN